VEDPLEEIWRHVDGALRNAVPATIHRAWLEPLRPVALQDEILYLQAPASSREWILRRFGGLIEAASGAHDAVRRIEVVDADQALPTPSTNLDLKPSYSFSSFVIGSGNRFAHAAALAAAELPGQAYNPLFVCGPPGVGKTHLLQAVGNYVTLCVSGLGVRYASAETFTSQFLDSLQRNRLPAFKQRYRTADVLLLDDVQFLESKDRTAEEFLYTLEAALNTGAQVVLSADRPPAAMPQLQTRLKDRFEGGLLVEIEPPDRAMRLAILRRHAGPDASELAASGVLDLLASRASTNVRSLESALIRARAYASLTQQPLTLELAEQVLAATLSHSDDQGHGTPSIDRIQDITAAVLKLDRGTITSARRSRQVVYARQVAMYLCRELTDHSLPAIAQRFGGRDHTTVLHAHRKVKQSMLVDTPTRDLVNRLVSDLARD
jgi:chromosomal replication initiator protein